MTNWKVNEKVDGKEVINANKWDDVKKFLLKCLKFLWFLLGLWVLVIIWAVFWFWWIAILVIIWLWFVSIFFWKD